MSNVYVVQDDATSIAMARVRCRDEDKELQRLLELNPDLLPGDQIDPSDPPRWLLIKREMPVPDPSSGSDRWGIDLFFTDHNAVPTLVECKRFADTRSRREVMGQMLDYAANGSHYWDKDRIRGYLAETHANRLEATFAGLRSEAGELDVLCAQVAENLSEGRMRLVFFMEEAPPELKSIVEFLNTKTKDIDVLIVEACQYEHAGRRVVVPRLFGFTEQIRRQREARKSGSSARRRWNRETFFEQAEADLAPATVAAARAILDRGESLGYAVKWGTGSQTGSFGLAWDKVSIKSLFTINTEGKLWWNFGWFAQSPETPALRDKLARLVQESIGGKFSADDMDRYPSVEENEWVPRAEGIASVLAQLGEEDATDSPS